MEVRIINHYLECKWKGLIRSKSNLDEWILFFLMKMANPRNCKLRIIAMSFVANSS
jgi:hypothetical protein